MVLFGEEDYAEGQFFLPVTLGSCQWAGHIISLHFSFLIRNGEVPCKTSNACLALRLMRTYVLSVFLLYLQCPAQCLDIIGAQ